MRTTRTFALLGLPVLLLLLAPLTHAHPASEPTAESGFASPLFERVWRRTDAPVAAGVARRSWTWGPGAGLTRQEPFGGTDRTVQYFDKGRMEVNPAVSDPSSPWAATSGLLTVELVSGRVQTGADSFENRTPAAVPLAGEAPAPGDSRVPTYADFAAVASLPGGADRRVPPNRRPVVATISRTGVGSLPESKANIVSNVGYAAETGHNIPDVFWSFARGQGFVANSGAGYEFRQLFDPTFVLGYPISEAYWSTAIINGKATQVLIQLYQRRVLTYVPGFATAWQVQMGNVGAQYYAWRYGMPLPPAAPIAVAAPPHPPAEAFVRVQGTHLVWHGGQPVTLKGTNYWLHTAPFVDTWGEWDGAQVAAELAKAHELGVNSVRITLPYIHVPIPLVWGDKVSERVNGPIIQLMTQLLQIAAGYDMKVMFALFDGTDRVDDPSAAEFRQELNYVQGIVEPFADDDRVLAWDLKNEPDNSPVWLKGDAAQSIHWLSQMAAAVRAADVRHPITVGMGQAANLWAAPDGLRVLDFVDFVSFHSYDAGGFVSQIQAVQDHTAKPVVVSEFGWPTGPARESSAAATYDEATQSYLYRTMLPAAQAAGVAGVLQWTLWDYERGDGRPDHESFFGLVRADGTFKPAADLFRAAPGALLPSQTHSTLPLTRADSLPDIRP
ncbi:MAG: cellulase family glycosylhydrolase [Chloroflexota bacterium]|nr:cellulase family glycosylhydrolase [Chloroflexota bacterium]